MNIIERAQAHLQSIIALAKRSVGTGNAVRSVAVRWRVAGRFISAGRVAGRWSAGSAGPAPQL